METKISQLTFAVRLAIFVNQYWKLIYSRRKLKTHLFLFHHHDFKAWRQIQMSHDLYQCLHNITWMSMNMILLMSAMWCKRMFSWYSPIALGGHGWAVHLRKVASHVGADRCFPEWYKTKLYKHYCFDTFLAFHTYYYICVSWCTRMWR